MLYDTAEAETILGRSHAARDPVAHRGRRATALFELRNAVEKAARLAGYETTRQGEVLLVPHARRSVFLDVRDDDVRIGSPADPNAAITLAELPIIFDPNMGIFVGTEADTFRHAEPGTPRRQRSAVAVIAAEIVKRLDEGRAK